MDGDTYAFTDAGLTIEMREATITLLGVDELF
jgi:hypothetical protein